jgi:hypothetical protein
MNGNVRREDDDEAFLRRLTFPEEDRALFTSVPWRGGFRWFRSPNVICLERERRRRKANLESSELKPPSG